MEKTKRCSLCTSEIRIPLSTDTNILEYFNHIHNKGWRDIWISTPSGEGVQVACGFYCPKCVIIVEAYQKLQ